MVQRLILCVCVCGAQLLAGRYFYVAAWQSMRHGVANMDVLVTLTTSISYAYSLLVVALAVALALPYSPMTFFDTSPMLFLCLSLGRWLEYLAKARTSDALARLLCLQAAEARICELEPLSGRVLAERCLPADLVKRGDLLKVLPGATRLLFCYCLLILRSSHLTIRSFRARLIAAAECVRAYAVSLWQSSSCTSHALALAHCPTRLHALLIYILHINSCVLSSLSHVASEHTPHLLLLSPPHASHFTRGNELRRSLFTEILYS